MLLITSFVLFYRAAKDGKYKGLSENEHLDDVSIYTRKLIEHSNQKSN